MAAEYSRELAFKCVAVQERVLAMGFQMGYQPPLGYRRESVSADGLRHVLLEPGQRKFALTDRIRWVLASDEEVALVRHIFDVYAHSGCSLRDLVQTRPHRRYLDAIARFARLGKKEAISRVAALIP